MSNGEDSAHCEEKTLMEENNLLEVVQVAIEKSLQRVHVQLDRIEEALKIKRKEFEVPLLFRPQDRTPLVKFEDERQGESSQRLSHRSDNPPPELLPSRSISVGTKSVPLGPLRTISGGSFTKDLKKHYHKRNAGPSSLANLDKIDPAGVSRMYATDDSKVHTDFGSVTSFSTNDWIHEAVFKARLQNQGAVFQYFLYRLLVIHTWWKSVREPTRHGFLAVIVQSGAFESLCVIVILFNSIFLARVADVMMQNLHDDAWPEVDWVENCLLVFYTVELCMRLYVHRWYFFLNHEFGWNVFDFVLVVSSLMEVAMRFASDSAGGNVFVMRTFRILKLARTLRALRAIRFCKELLNLLTSMKKSLVALFWSLILVIIALYIFAIVFLHALSEKLKDRKCFDEECDDYNRVLKTFGSMGQAMLSLCMAMTGGREWAIYYDVIDMAGSVYSVLFLLFIFFVMFALVNVMCAIFVEKALAAAAPDRHGKILEQRRKNIEDAAAFRELCQKIVGYEKDTITWCEFTEAMEDEATLMHLASIGLQVHDVRLFFNIVAGVADSDEVSIGRFVEGCLQMTGNATAIDMQRQLYQIGNIHSDLKVMGHILINNMERFRKMQPNPPHAETSIML